MSTSYYWVILELVKLVLSIQAIREMVLMFKYIKPRIVWPYGAILKCGQVIRISKASQILILNITFASKKADELITWLFQK